MSQFVELAAKLQEQQIEAVKRSQEAFLKFVQAAADNAPEAQSVEVPEQVRQAMRPAFDFFGSPEEVQAFLNDSARTWAELGADFQNRVLDEVSKIADEAAEQGEEVAEEADKAGDDKKAGKKA